MSTQRSSESTLATACAPTTWLVGVTRGGYPISARRRGISSRTASSFLAAPLAARSASTRPRVHPFRDLVGADIGVGLLRPGLELGRVFLEQVFELGLDLAQQGGVET